VKRSKTVNTRRTLSQMVLLREQIYEVVLKTAHTTLRPAFY
jgi:DNA topoisomerase VI subunit A